MGMFKSRFECKVDAKGRLALPAKMKAAIPESNGGELILRQGDDGCLALYTQIEFKKLLHKVSALSDRDPVQRLIKRSFFESMTEVELDNAGRFLIPKTFLSWSGIEKDAILIGLGGFVEIWSPEKYRQNVVVDQAELSKLMDQYLS
ncbi:division/cell wall cluster transcriptional repressor MraZ [Arthrospiribacter ruber]|uniref:Transcriptional regulator MraZ n=1 Tax=Arthrospiribacter ruber TaxID=2487934 RepID=A0A951J043_9BACT|nr:division/cell wall cluster transcriptional repressor MraZ [Arthrospiribacter ruber]MBW3468887.1 division/cell wall cluster transcriptional repressor MraZ [Arthrospiribacter ruber]